MRSFIVLEFALLALTALDTESALAARYLRQSAFDCKSTSGALSGNVEDFGPSISHSVKKTANTNGYSDELVCAFPGTSRFPHSAVTGVNVHGSRVDALQGIDVLVCRPTTDYPSLACTGKYVTTTGNWTATFASSEIPVGSTDARLFVIVILNNGDTLRGVFYSAP
jgi:hypothetical protein